MDMYAQFIFQDFHSSVELMDIEFPFLEIQLGILNNDVIHHFNLSL